MTLPIPAAWWTLPAAAVVMGPDGHRWWATYYPLTHHAVLISQADVTRWISVPVPTGREPVLWYPTTEDEALGMLGQHFTLRMISDIH